MGYLNHASMDQVLSSSDAQAVLSSLTVRENGLEDANRSKYLTQRECDAARRE